jgi:hypothetical protein
MNFKRGYKKPEKRITWATPKEFQDNYEKKTPSEDGNEPSSMYVQTEQNRPVLPVEK